MNNTLNDLQTQRIDTVKHDLSVDQELVDLIESYIADGYKYNKVGCDFILTKGDDFISTDKFDINYQTYHAISKMVEKIEQEEKPSRLDITFGNSAILPVYTAFNQDLGCNVTSRSPTKSKNKIKSKTKGKFNRPLVHRRRNKTDGTLKMGVDMRQFINSLKEKSCQSEKPPKAGKLTILQTILKPRQKQRSA